MTDYIKREDAVDALNSEGYTKNMRVHKKILNLSSADVVERKYGKWKVKKINAGQRDIPFEIYVHVCSACGGTTPVDVSRYKFCPNCGSEMKE